MIPKRFSDKIMLILGIRALPGKVRSGFPSGMRQTKGIERESDSVKR
ncbi:hypothetical protein GGD50_003863 [Rhizobium paranaense]|uniref:Uncharacterized protein n=1 Tax=Rhizobium paranaense TaxID=1650438 RepID=A0A7W8XTB7_9HYPH|nr:hypothetical protein [Rhizobium paranaense]